MALANQNLDAFYNLIASPSRTIIGDSTVVEGMELYSFCTFKIGIVLPPEEGGKISEKFTRDNLVKVAFYNFQVLDDQACNNAYWFPYLRKRVSYTKNSKEKSDKGAKDEADSKERYRAGSFFYPSPKSKVVVAFVDKSLYNGVIIGCIADNYNSLFYDKPNKIKLKKGVTQPSEAENKLALGNDESGNVIEDTIGFAKDDTNQNPKYYVNSNSMGMEIKSNKTRGVTQNQQKGSQINLYSESNDGRYSTFMMMDADKEAKKSIALNFSNIKLKADNIKFNAGKDIKIYSKKDVNAVAGDIYKDPIASELNKPFEMKKHADPGSEFKITVDSGANITAQADKNLNIISKEANFNPQQGRLIIEGKKVAIVGDEIGPAIPGTGCTHKTMYTAPPPSPPVTLPTQYILKGEIKGSAATVKSGGTAIATINSKVVIKHNNAPSTDWTDVIEPMRGSLMPFNSAQYFAGPVAMFGQTNPRFNPSGNPSQTVFLGSGSSEPIILEGSLVNTCDEISPEKKGKVVIK